MRVVVNFKRLRNDRTISACVGRAKKNLKCVVYRKLHAIFAVDIFYTNRDLIIIN